MGLPRDLNLQGNEFSNIATFLFVGLMVFEIPNSKCSLPFFPPLPPLWEDAVCLAWLSLSAV
jgi:hypothetical protein